MWIAIKTFQGLAIRGTLCLFGVSYFAFTPAKATVFEYDLSGKVTVTDTRPDQTANVPVSKPPQHTRLRAQTREIALDYAGSSGVRAANLNALTFVEVFEALIERESAFNPLAVSEKGAMGLGQLMPHTATELGVGNPFDPNANLIGSAKYFTQQLQRFGDLELALAAYNAGPERVEKYGGVPPFKETQAYIAWILEQADIEAAKPKAGQSEIRALPINKEQPLKGEVSVWEF